MASLSKAKGPKGSISLRKKWGSYAFHLCLAFVSGALISSICVLNYVLTTHDAKALQITKSLPATPSFKISEDNLTSKGVRAASYDNSDVIVYLAQFGHHSSYGMQNDGRGASVTGASKLERSLDSLFANYVNHFPCDVIVFYGEDNDPEPDLFQKFQRKFPRLRFHQLYGKWWSLPHGLKEEDAGRWVLPGYSVGYRHMIRWYAYLIWPYLDELGYTHVMRMDDDSYIHSRIGYNLFEYMRENNKRYGFRQPCTDSIGEKPLRAIVNRFLKDNPGIARQEMVEDYLTLPTLGFYNNWFVADINFFLESPVSSLLRTIDESKIMYTQRSNDLLIQSVLVRLFLTHDQIKWFTDFSYEHLTVQTRGDLKGCPVYGGFSYGYGTDLALWKNVSQTFLDRFPSHCKLFKTFLANSAMNGTAQEELKCIGTYHVCECELFDSNCGFYVKKLVI
eukprot:scaffold248476_cov125-Cyclotella_meneghiniana.AAC.4